MTARADRLTKRAKSLERAATSGPSDPARVVRVFVEAMERLGYDMDPLLAQAGFCRSEFECDPDARIPCSASVPMFQHAAQQRPLKNPGVRVAAVTPIGAFPLLDYVIVTSDTVGDAIRQLARYFGLVDAPHVLDVQEGEDPIRVVFESRDGHNSAFGFEFGVAVNLLHIRDEAGDCFRASYASFRHTPDDAAEIEAVLGCPVQPRATWNGFALSRRVWNLPLRRRDPILASLLQRQADEAIARLPSTDGVVHDVRKALASRVAGGDTRIQAVARALATSVRSLQRRLAATGSSYQQLLDQARKDAAERHLAESLLSIGEVAYLLGYSEAAAFNRAFRRWHQQTPQAFRARRREERLRLANRPGSGDNPSTN
jgi:AraC-like DNA-binding protein